MNSTNRKVAFIHDEFPYGGGERVTIDVARFISGYNYSVFVFARKVNEELLPQGEELPFTIITLPERSVERSKRNAEVIAQSINSLGIDVLISVGRQLRHVESILNSTKCKFVYALHSKPFWETQQKIINLRRKSEASFVAKLKWLLISYPIYELLGKAKWSVESRYRELYRVSDRFLVLCDGYRNEVEQRLSIDPSSSKVRAINNSESAATIHSQERKNQLLFVGRLTYADKRVDRLLNIWSQIEESLPEWKLTIVGDGDQRSVLEDMSRSLSLKRVEFVGSSNLVHQYLSESKVLCLTSTFEGWPLALTEAQAYGVVPIAFNCSAGVESIVAPSGVNGILIAPFDLDHYASELLSLLKDDERLASMSRNAVTKSQEYSIEVVGRQWLSLFDELLSK